MKMVMKNKSRGLGKLKISNRLSYTLIAVVAIVLIAAGVYAITPMVAPNPGHTMAEIAPGPCTSGQYLQWSGSQWNCATVTSGGISTPSPCSSGQYLQWTGSAWICAAPTATDTRFTIGANGLCYTAPSTCSLTTETCNSHKAIVVSVSCGSYTPSQINSVCLTQCNNGGSACDGTQTSCSGGTTASYTSATGFCESPDLYCNCNSGSSYSQEHYTAAGQRCI